jgi:hypothetical protein
MYCVQIFKQAYELLTSTSWTAAFYCPFVLHRPTDLSTAPRGAISPTLGTIAQQCLSVDEGQFCSIAYTLQCGCVDACLDCSVLYSVAVLMQVSL